MRIATASRIAAAVLGLTIAGMMGLGWLALRELKVGGPVYARVVMGKGLIADVLPPPAYLIEAFLETTLLVNEPWSLEPRRKRLAQLRKEYEERLAFWGKQDLGASLRNQLVSASHESAMRFWETTERRFLPAVEKGDIEAANDAFLAMKEDFEAHRIMNVEVVAEANRFNVAVEAAAARTEQLILMAVGGMAVLIFALVGACIASVMRGLVRPVERMTHEMTRLAGGDLDIDLSGHRRANEIGQMAKAVLVIRDAAIDKIRVERESEEGRVSGEKARRQAEHEAIARERAAVAGSVGAGLARLAAKDLTYRMSGAMPEAYSKLQADFNAALDQLEQAVLSVKEITEVMDAGTHEISIASDNLARRTEQQAANLEETAAALDQITVTVNHAADGAVRARQVVATAHGDADTGGDVVRKAVEAMGGIEKSSQQISQIIGVIDEIAFQTNLLALNAGVEAARAGDAGRGFAVVASEVRALAQRSAEAAKEIKGLISASTAQVEEGVRLVGETGTSFKQIVGDVSDINGAIGDIARGAQEQAGGLQQVNAAVSEMDKMTQQNAAMAEQATAASQQLSQEAARLSRLVAQFQVRRSAMARRAA